MIVLVDRDSQICSDWKHNYTGVQEVARAM
jgi:hypothetical protein